jgi:DNA-binding NtrC family response regulator
MIRARKSSPLPSQILLVNDNPDGNIARKMLLEEQGLAVRAVGSSEDALEVFLAGHFDVVVTDVKGKRTDGLKLIQSIGEQRPGTPVILLGSAAAVMGLSEESTGADAVIAKSSKEHEQLLRTVRQLLARRLLRKPVRSQKRARTSVARSG